MADTLHKYHIETPYGSLNLTTNHHHSDFSDMDKWYNAHHDVIANAFNLAYLSYKAVTVHIGHVENVEKEVVAY